MELLLLGIVLGLLWGWWARTIRDHIRTLIGKLHQQIMVRPPIEEPKQNESGVVIGHLAHQKGAVIQLPPYDPKGSAIVRPRTPQQVKKDGDKYIDQVIEEVKAK